MLTGKNIKSRNTHTYMHTYAHPHNIHNNVDYSKVAIVEQFGRDDILISDARSTGHLFGEKLLHMNYKAKKYINYKTINLLYYKIKINYIPNTK